MPREWLLRSCLARKYAIGCGVQEIRVERIYKKTRLYTPVSKKKVESDNQVWLLILKKSCKQDKRRVAVVPRDLSGHEGSTVQLGSLEDHLGHERWAESAYIKTANGNYESVVDYESVGDYGSAGGLGTVETGNYVVSRADLRSLIINVSNGLEAEEEEEEEEGTDLYN